MANATDQSYFESAAAMHYPWGEMIFTPSGRLVLNNGYGAVVCVGTID